MEAGDLLPSPTGPNPKKMANLAVDREYRHSNTSLCLDLGCRDVVCCLALLGANEVVQRWIEPPFLANSENSWRDTNEFAALPIEECGDPIRKTGRQSS